MTVGCRDQVRVIISGRRVELPLVYGGTGCVNRTYNYGYVSFHNKYPLKNKGGEATLAWVL
jgi:hypothetical protein